MPAWLAGAAIKRGLGLAKTFLPLVLLIGLAIYILSLQAHVRSLTKERTALRGWQADMIAAVRSEIPAPRRPSVVVSTAGDEVHWLGREYRTAAAALETQSKALAVAAGKAADADKAVKDGLRAATGRDKAREATRAALTAEKRSTGLTQQEWDQL